LWQKILATVIFLIIGGDFSWPAAVCFVGSVGWRVLFALGFGPLWATMRYQIRADENGISQTNGFFRQPATWSEVQSYYVAVNPRFHKGRHRYVEPFLLNAHGDIIFQSFEHIFISTEAIFRQRQEL
jgi:hypothetical protein